MAREQTSRSLAARWIFPVNSSPIENGIVHLHEGRIRSIEPARRQAVDADYGDAAIVPGFVNAHTHLDLTGLRGLAPPRPDFSCWLLDVIRHRQNVTREQIEADIRA